MEAIQRKEGVRPSRLPKDFQIMQEDLRRFVLRRFIEEKKLSTLALYYLAPAKLKNTVLFLCSLVFYCWGEVRFFPDVYKRQALPRQAAPPVPCQTSRLPYR